MTPSVPGGIDSGAVQLFLVLRERPRLEREPVDVEGDEHLGKGPAVVAPEPPEWQVVEELVREDHALDVLVERLERRGDANLRLDPAEGQARAGAALDGRVLERNSLELPQQLLRERSVPGAHLDERHGVGSAEAAPALTDRLPHELPEHRVHVGARHEVAALADRRFLVEAAGAVQRELHELRERDRAVVRDGPADGTLGLGVLHVLFGHRRPSRRPARARGCCGQLRGVCAGGARFAEA
jgi:hypothetical protein